jgi:hypothetical protein
MAETRHALKPSSTPGSLRNMLSKQSSEPAGAKSSRSGLSSMSGGRFKAALAHLKQSTNMVTAPLTAAKASVQATLQQVKTHIQDTLIRPSLMHSAVQRRTGTQYSTEVAAVAVMMRDKLLSASTVQEHAAALMYAKLRLDGLLQSSKFVGWDEHTRLMVRTASDLCDVQTDVPLGQDTVSRDLIINSCSALATLCCDLVEKCCPGGTHEDECTTTTL